MNAVLKPAEPRVGIFPDEPAEVYHVRNLGEANASGLTQMLRSPAHFKEWVEHPEADKTSPALEFGRAFHCATLEPDVFEARYVVVPGDAPRYPTDAQWNAKGKRSPDSQAAVDYWLQWNADNGSRTRLSAADYDRARRMADSVRAHPVARGLLVGGDRETTMRWIDEETGIPCRARPDLRAEGEFTMDLKSTRDASHEGFARSVAGFHYDLQQSFYLAAEKALAKPVRYFIFLACESEAPYVCQPYVLDPAAEQRGYALHRRAITKQAECLRTGRWPGYSEELSSLTLPAWAHYGIEEAA